jgi:Predicted restriction endonuclease
MRRTKAEQLIQIISDSKNILENYSIDSIDLVGETVSSFHQWADNKHVLDLTLVSSSSGGRYYFMIIDWREDKDDYYLVIFPDDKSRPIAELHKTEEVNGWGENLTWKYAPTKRDGRNPERKAYFKHYFGNVTVNVALPKIPIDVNDFFDDIFALCSNRLKADELSVNVPDRRVEFPEGRLFEKLHKQKERNSKVIALAKRNMKQRLGKLVCQVCTFDFKERYGSIGEDFIEAHHTIPVHTLDNNAKTRVEDIALVCSNCHSMIHRTSPCLTIDQLKSMLSSSIEQNK